MTQNESPRSRGELSKAVTTNIRSLRNLKGLTQAALAAMVNLDSTAIAKMEKGRRNVSVEEAWEIAAVLDVPIERLFDYPGAAEDRRFQALLLAPQRELQARLKELEHFVSGSGDSTLDEMIARLASGLDAYVDKEPAPPLTADPDLVSETLSTVRSLLERHQAFRRDVLIALAALATGEAAKNERAARRVLSRVVSQRGDAPST